MFIIPIQLYPISKTLSMHYHLKEEQLETKKCPKCGRAIIGFSEDPSTTNYSYRLRWNLHNEEVCAYCMYDTYINSIRSNCIQTDKQNNNEEQEVLKLIRKPSHIFSYDLLVVKTHCNSAMVYGNNVNDVNYSFHNGGHNPYVFYFFCKEIYQNFMRLEEYHDYFYKLIAAQVLSRWEKTDKYESEIKSLINYIKENFKSDFEFEECANDLNRLELDPELQLADDILSDFYSKFYKYYGTLSTSHNEQDRQSVLDNILNLINDIQRGRYTYNGKEYDLGRITYYSPKGTISNNDSNTISEPYDVSLFSQISAALAYELLPEINFIKFIAWKVKDNENINSAYLEQCLDGIDFVLDKFYSKTSTHYGYKTQNITINKLHKIEQDLSHFCSFHSKILNDKFKKFDQPIGPTTIIPTSGDIEGNLNKNDLLLYIINMLPTLYMVYYIFSSLKNNYHEEEEYEEFTNPDLDELERLMDSFNTNYSKLARIGYKNKEKLEQLFKYGQSGDNSENQYSIRVNQLIYHLISFYNSTTTFLLNVLDRNNNTTDIKKSIDKIFDDKRAVFKLDTLPEDLQYEFETALNNFKNALVHFVVSKSTGNILFDDVKEKLTLDLGNKLHYIEGTIFNTLATAEYLYKLFDIEKKLQEGDLDDDKDFSCISILYYKALEDLLNQVVYHPYKNSYLTSYTSYNDDDDIRQDRSILIRYLPPKPEKHIYKYNNIMQKKELPSNLMLGNFVKLLKYNANKDMFINFLSTMPFISTTYISDMDSFSKELDNIKDRRNGAAHSGNIPLQSVKQDRENIYNINSATNYRELIRKFLGMLR